MINTPFRRKFDVNRTWITSDQHQWHKNIVKSLSSWTSGYRTEFNSLQEMEDVLVDNINSKVDTDDTLFDLGDFIFGDKEQIFRIRNRIRCRNIHLILGNHDTHIRNSLEKQSIFSSCSDYLEVFIGKKLLVLTHYPFMIWNESHRNSYNLRGHSHGSLPDDIKSKSLDCGMDTCLFGHTKYMPYSFNEIDDIMRNKKEEIEFKDHHTKDVD